MFDLAILVSRYLFLLYGVAFLVAGIKALLSEHKETHKNRQFIFIVLTHIHAFLILCAGTQSIDTIIIGVASLLFIIFCYLLLNKVYSKSSKLIWNCILFLFVVSIIMLERLNPSLAQKQLIYSFVGAATVVVMKFLLDVFYRFDKLKWVYLVLSIVLILLPFFLGTEQYGAKNWVSLGKSFGNISFQPSEFVKLLFVLFTASYLSSMKKEANSLSINNRNQAIRCYLRISSKYTSLIFPAAVSAVLVIILVLQKDLGGALIYFLSFVIMVYISTEKEWIFFSGIGFGALASFFAYNIFSHVQVRVQAWINPWSDIDNRGYQITQSIFAIYTWGIFGSGLTKGYSYYIPFVEKDFIFSAVCEEFGYVFGICVIGVYTLLFIKAYKIAIDCDNKFYSLLTCGITTVFAFQAFLIIGGVIKLIPLSGVTLPFISYGGSSVFISFVMIGFIQWISRKKVTYEE